jgi:hypothetical protein
MASIELVNAGIVTPALRSRLCLLVEVVQGADRCGQQVAQVVFAVAAIFDAPAQPGTPFGCGIFEVMAKLTRCGAYFICGDQLIDLSPYVSLFPFLRAVIDMPFAEGPFNFLGSCGTLKKR